ncbi:cobyric acid synthase [Pararhodospirillum oryzae]|uniref:Cobyric acid synthase n=1 Tax=Pararhodospirillum oryzae TaxID=478448 RepID=A0A512H6M0_9PROT|nr:cobyric acid synthase [Pararhodospirillum oryzae]GEO81109.1 cobyric acid synthase [Pararhodospirillum oryzae]
MISRSPAGTGGKRARALMIQGTGSDVGKSLLVAGLARALTRRGLVVRPFKPQNMSNNAAVTADGGEIGRAQALQARACGVAPSVHMNPVLLKPQAEIGAQVVVQGEVHGAASAGAYRALAPALLAAVLDSFGRLQAEADLVLVEGAGSPAELNLRAGDIANMGFAEAADVPVVLVADASRGGLAAQVVGTHALLSGAERDRIQGVIANKTDDPRGERVALGVATAATGWPGVGVVPWLAAAACLPAEDAAALDHAKPCGSAWGGSKRPVRVVVPRLSRLSNFDDFDPLRAEPDVALTFVPPGQPLSRDADLVIVPGSKASLADLAFLRAQGWDLDLRAHARAGGRILGLCGGYQMLGRSVADPEGVEGEAAAAPGLGLLEVDTVLAGAKVLRPVWLTDRLWGKGVGGYEMHLGRTQGPDTVRAWLGADSARSADGRILGTYVHGLFAEDAFRAAFLAWLRPERQAPEGSFQGRVEAALDALAGHVAASVDLDALDRMAR